MLAQHAGCGQSGMTRRLSHGRSLLVACGWFRPVLLCAAAAAGMAAAYRPESGHAGARMEAMGGVEANAYSLV